MCLDQSTLWWLGIALLMMLMDVIFGLARAIVDHEVSSAAMRKGLRHKLGSLICILVGVLFEIGSRHVDLGIGKGALIVICAYIITMETASIFEIIKQLNPGFADSPVGKLFGEDKHDKTA